MSRDTEELVGLRDVVRRLLADHLPALPEYASAGPLPLDAAKLVGAARELGLDDLESEDGGFAYTAAALAEVGAALGPGELASGLALAPLGAGLVSGFGIAASWGGDNLDALSRSSSGELSGRLDWVVGAGTGSQVLVFNHDQALLVDTGSDRVTLEPIPASDMSRALHSLVLDAVGGDSVRPVASGDSATELWENLVDRIDLALALDSLGVARSALGLTIEYAKIRRQFGAPIGSFQAVKHRAVDMFVAVQRAEVMVEHAVAAYASGSEDRSRAAAQARAVACEAAVEVTRDAVTSHGAIGYTWEHPCHLLVRRAGLNQALGTPSRVSRRATARRLVATHGKPASDAGVKGDV